MNFEEVFAKSDETDVILVVDGKKLHVNKALLSDDSDYFKTLFNIDLKEFSMNGYPIEEVEFDDFGMLLSLIHGRPIIPNGEMDLKKFLEDRFTESIKTDVCLIVQGKRLYVTKAILSHHSPFFEALFNQDFKEKSMKEIKMSDVDYDEFVVFLSIFHQDPMKPTIRNAEKILVYADRFLCSIVKNYMELFLISTRMKFEDKLRIGDKYKLNDLVDNTVAQLNKNNKHLFMKSISFTSGLSDRTKNKVLMQMMKLCKC
uniref:BTB domain-containing protein n=1 Tax=Caenorhabditis tropicalis TaxID=1561998 RepID=A0A1I7UI48_9PELO